MVIAIDVVVAVGPPTIRISVPIGNATEELAGIVIVWPVAVTYMCLPISVNAKVIPVAVEFCG